MKPFTWFRVMADDPVLGAKAGDLIREEAGRDEVELYRLMPEGRSALLEALAAGRVEATNSHLQLVR